MIEHLTQYWKLWLLLLFTVILTVFVWVMAIRAGAKRTALRNEELAKIDRHNRLRKDFAEVSPEFIQQSDEADLFDGITENIIAKLEKADDDAALFETLGNPQKYVYTLSFIRDLAGGGSVRNFFRECGPVIGKYAGESLAAVGLRELSALFGEAFAVYDETNLETSADEKTINNLEERFQALWSGVDLNSLTVRYIKQNAQEF